MRGFMFIVFLLPCVSFAQIHKACGLNYSISPNKAVQWSKSCQEDSELYSYLYRIREALGVETPINSIVFRISDKPDFAFATVRNLDKNNEANKDQLIGINSRYYQGLFDKEIEKKAIIFWIIAHEYFHHLYPTYFKQYNEYSDITSEILADEKAGYVIGKLKEFDELTVDFFDYALPMVLSNGNTFTNTHPRRPYRVLAAKAGFVCAKGEREELSSKYILESVGKHKVHDYKYIRKDKYTQWIFNNIMKEKRNDKRSLYLGYTNSQGDYNGMGVLMDNKGIYFGNFSNNKFSQLGYFLSHDSKYYGHFLNNAFDGKGKITYLNGERIEGYWKLGKLHGYCTIFSKSGKVIKKGCFKNGVYFGETCIN